MYIDNSANVLLDAIKIQDVNMIKHWISIQRNVNATLNCVEFIGGCHLSAFQITAIELGCHKKTNILTAILDVFIQAGANIDAVDDDGESVLFHALNGNHHWVIDYLITKEVNVNVQNQHGRTVFHLMSDWSLTKAVKTSLGKLLSLKPKLNLQDVDGNTPLHLARNNVMATFLLKNGASLNIRNDDGKYPDESIAIALGGETSFTNGLRNRRIAQEMNTLQKVCPPTSPKLEVRPRL